MEVRADWPVRTGYHDSIWFHYAVETLPAVTVEAGAVYALEYEVKTDTWTLFRLEKTGRLVKRVSSRKIYKTGRICIGQSFVAMERHYDYILDLGHIIYKVLVISSGGEFA